MPDLYDEDDLYIDGNGCPTERMSIGGEQVVIHYDDLPEKDVTVVDGIPCTTALRTVIDLATDVDADHLQRMVDDCLKRQLFTFDEALARLAEDDMDARPGARLVLRAISFRQII